MTQRGYTLQFNGDQVAAELRGAAERGVLMAGEYVLGESQAVVPIDEAALSRSGTVSVDPAVLIAAISYDTPYAVIQHERMDFRHAPGRQAKFLEQPLIQSRGQVQAIIAAQLRRALR